MFFGKNNKSGNTIVEDNLKKILDLKMKIYEIIGKNNKSGNTIVEDNSNKILGLKIRISEIIRRDFLDNKFSLFSFDIVKEYLRKAQDLGNYDAYSYIFQILSKPNSDATISLSTGEYLNKLMKDCNGVLGIHRTNVGKIDYIDGIPTNINLSDIVNNGFINNGHLSSGMMIENPSMSLAVSPFYNIDGLLNLVSPYKDNNVIILFQFPNDIMSKDLRFNVDPKDFYQSDNRVSPKYILGVIIKENNKLEFYSLEQLTNVNKTYK